MQQASLPPDAFHTHVGADAVAQQADSTAGLQALPCVTTNPSSMSVPFIFHDNYIVNQDGKDKWVKLLVPNLLFLLDSEGKAEIKGEATSSPPNV